MGTTIWNLDETAFRALQARAVMLCKTIGELVSEAIRAYLAQPQAAPRQANLRDFPQREYPPGNERMSEEVDAIVYGV
ncbi:MAG: hypothetical protein HC897_09870 [Thermoanaerobaculia bacterium]|nr:hypothetical protein [Thermoanaerobaculia bacterium]